MIVEYLLIAFIEGQHTVHLTRYAELETCSRDARSLSLFVQSDYQNTFNIDDDLLDQISAFKNKWETYPIYIPEEMPVNISELIRWLEILERDISVTTTFASINNYVDLEMDATSFLKTIKLYISTLTDQRKINRKRAEYALTSSSIEYKCIAIIQ